MPHSHPVSLPLALAREATVLPSDVISNERGHLGLLRVEV